MSPVPLDLVAEADRFDPDDPTRTRRRSAASRRSRPRPGRVRSVRLLPPGAPACAAAVDAVREADVVVLGPGSWFTSVIPHLLLRELGTRAGRPPRARVVVTLNLVPQPGETDGLLAGRAAANAAASTPSRSADCASTPCSPTPTRCSIDKELADFTRAIGARLVLSKLAARRQRRAARSACGSAEAYRRHRGRSDRRRTGGRVEGRRMAMTAAVKDELSRVPVPKTSARKAEIATMLRFAGALHLVGGHIVIEAELDTGSVARRLRKEIADIFGHGSEVQIVAGGGLRKGSRYLVRVTKDGEGLARQAGLVDLRGRPVQGPAAPRRGRRHRRRRGGLARRVPRPRLAHRAGPRLLARDHLPVGRGGAGAGRRRPPARACRPRRARCAAATASSSATATRSARCSPASARTSRCWPGRSGGCAARCAPPPTGWPTSTTPTCAARRAPRWRPARGSSGRWRSSADDAPEHLLQAGRLRLEHKQASLEELGALSDPPMTKDAVAGRIRRLLAMADKRAADLGIPDTESAVTPEMLAPDRTGR